MRRLSGYGKKIVAIGLIMLVTFLLLGIYWIGNSQSGLRWLLNQAQQHAPGKLRIASVEGKLFRQVVLKQLEFEQQNGLKLSLDQLRFSWELTALASRRLKIEQLQIDRLNVQLPATAEHRKKDKNSGAIKLEQLPTIQLPLPVEIQTINLNEFELQYKPINTKQNSLHISSLALQNILLSDALSIAQAQLKIPKQPQVPALELRWNLQSDLRPPYLSKLKLFWFAEISKDLLPHEQFPNGLNATGELAINGDLEHLRIHHQLQKPMSIDLNAQLYQLLQKLSWDTEVSWQQVSWPIEESNPDIEKLLVLKRGRLTAQGDLKAYRLAFDSQLESAQLPSSSWTLRGNGDFKHFNIEALNTLLLNGNIKSHGKIIWHPQIHAQIESDVSALQIAQWKPEIPIKTPIDAQLSIGFQDQRLDIKQLSVELPETRAVIRLKGHIDELKTQPQADLQLSWQELRWPIMESPSMLISPQGQVDIQGGADSYQLKFNTRLSGKDIPEGDWQGEMDGDTEKINSLEMQGKLLNGMIQLLGDASWSQTPRWKVHIKGKELNPAGQWPELPGVLNFTIHHSAELQQDKLKAWLKVDQLYGKIKGYPIRAKANISTNGKQHHLKRLDFYSGQNHLSAKARLGTSELLDIDAEFNIDAPNLATFLPNASGWIRGQGKISGPLKRPNINTEVAIKKLKFEQLRIEQLNTKLMLVPAQNGKLDLQLSLKSLKNQGQLKIKKLNLETFGKIKKHQIQLKLDTPQETLKLGLDGGFNETEQRWAGMLKNLSLTSKILGSWNLNVPSKLQISPKKVSLQRSCFKTKQHVAEICSMLAWQDRGVAELEADIKQLSISQMAEPIIPPHIGLTGMILNGAIKAKLTESQMQPSEQAKIMKVESQIDLSISSGKVFTLLEGRQYILPFKGADLGATIDEKGLQGKLALQVFDKSNLNATWRLKDLYQLPLAEKQSIQAKLDARFLDLDILPSFSPILKNTHGQVDMSAKVNGGLDKPQLEGQLTLQAETEVPQLGLNLKNIQTQITTSKNYQQLQIKGGLESGEGFTRINGSLDLSKLPNWHSRLNISGENFSVIYNDDFKVWIAPDIQLQGQPELLQIGGRLNIPKARITPTIKLEAGGSKVNASSDVNIMDEEQGSSSQAESVWKIKGGMDLTMGDDIRIDVADFKSSIQGGVKMLFEPDSLIPKGQGEISIVDGTYKAYGQDLEISQGRIFFQGTPMDNPGLGIRAIRRIKNNAFNAVDVAGIDIRGTAKSPRLSLFSEPKVSDADIISYIVTGSALTGGDIESRELTLGKYISPTFYVSFGYDLFEGNKSFNLRYDINKRWGIEGLVGDRDSGVDASFTLGRE